MSISDDELPLIPSMLVQTFPLEAYLRNLSNKLSDKLNALQSTLNGLQGEVKSNTSSVSDIRRFLRQQSLKALQRKIAEGVIELPEGLSPESLLPVFIRDDLTLLAEEGSLADLSFLDFGESQGRGSVHTLSISKNGMKKDDAKKTGREEDEETHQRSGEVYKRLEKMYEEMEASQRQQMGDLERLMAWFRPISTPDNEEDNEDDEGEGGKKFGNTAFVCHSLHDVLQRSPLFLEFRQLLLRDMMDRLGEAKDQQSMVLGNTILALKGEMRRELLQNDGSGAEKGLTGDSSWGAGGGSDMERRLKGLDRNYMQRNEVKALLQEKANVTTVAQKANDVYVRDMEKQMLERIADMEERMSMYEAERKEFRRILRAIVDAQKQGKSIIISDVNKGADDGVIPPTNVPAKFVVVEDAVDSRLLREGGSLAADEGPASRRKPLSRSKQGDNRGIASVSAKEPLKQVHRQQQQQQQQQRSYGMAEVSTTSQRAAVGLTVNQEAYANYVTDELNRRTVEMLPPLPYERMHHR